MVSRVATFSLSQSGRGCEPRAWRAREREPIMGVWGQSPQRGPGAEPLVWGQGAKPPEAESILVIGCPTVPANLAPVRENSMFCYGPLVSELGAQSAWCLQPRHWGGGGPPAPPCSVAYVCVQPRRFHSQRDTAHIFRLRRRRSTDGAQQQTRPTPHWLSNDGTDKRTDGRPIVT